MLAAELGDGIFATDPELGLVESYRPAGGEGPRYCAGLGSRLRGVEGFRRTHRQAARAHRGATDRGDLIDYRESCED